MKTDTRASCVAPAEPAHGTGARSGRGLAAGLSAARSAGYEVEMVANNDRTVQCRSCRSAQPPVRLVVDHLDRAGGENTDDAAEMLAIVWTRCPRCRRPGTLTLGYGPNAGEADLTVLSSLDLGPLDVTDRELRPVF